LLLDVGTLVGEAVGGVEATVAGMGGSREGIGVFSQLSQAGGQAGGGREREHGGWGDAF
jgi:two-component system chemotaxis sensor kinase CheA